MCEIFVIDPSEEANNPEIIEANVRDMFSKNPDGIGFVAVYTDGEQFEYETYKSPEWETDEVSEFIDGHMDAWRLVTHARLATHGDTDKPQTHPIKADCPHCDIEMVVHNGVVSQEETWRQAHMDEGHEFSTRVDSEVILHENSTVPTDIDDFEVPELGGSLNYILFQDDAILMRSGYKYRDAEHFVMGKRKRCKWEDDSRKKKYLLVTPDEEVQIKEASSTRTSGSSGSSSSRRSRGGSYTGEWWPDGYDGNGSSSGGSRRSSGSRSGASSGDGTTDGDVPQKNYHDWEDWPPNHLEDPQEAS